MAKLRGGKTEEAEEDQGINKSNVRFGKSVPYLSKLKLLFYPEDESRKLN